MDTQIEKPLVIFGKPDEKTLGQINRCLADAPAARGVLCGDAHPGFSQCVGGVIGYYDHVAISGVGPDIACGNMAIKTDAKWNDIRKRHTQIADKMAELVDFGVGQGNSRPIDHELFDDDAWKISPLKQFKNDARRQLGSCGSSNHFCDVFTDENDNVWVGCHFGSRGVGFKTYSHFVQTLGGRDGMDAAPCLVSVHSSIGAEYLACMHLAGRYAYAGREHVCHLVAKEILGAKILDSVHNNHNFAWKENHHGQELWTVRKGSTPAFPGQRGFVGGSMGDISVILHGVDSPESRNALYSTVHGAGRIMSRTEAAGKSKWIYDDKLKRKVKTRVAEGKVNETSMRQRIKNMGIELRGGGADEAPEAYRPLQDVLGYHAGTIKVETVLTPKIVLMAGDDVFDPFKD